MIYFFTFIDIQVVYLYSFDMKYRLLKKGIILLVLLTVYNISIYPQTHISVPLGHPVYLALEQAQMRGLCEPLPAVKPYSMAKVLLLIDIILNNDDNRRFGKLAEAERTILESFKQTLNPPREKANFTRGTFSEETTVNDVYFSTEFGIGMKLILAGGYYPIAGGYKYKEGDNELFKGADHPSSGDFFGDISIIAPELSFIGDLGKSLSYGLTINGFIGKSPRTILGEYNNMDLENINTDRNKEQINVNTVRRDPFAYFPFTYKKRWDGFVFPADGVNHSGLSIWPDALSIGYSMMPELSGEFFSGHFEYRFARLDREWAGMTTNGSLVLNQSAQPFLAFETVISPFSWISFSSLTGVLEFHNAVGSGNNASVKDSSKVFQNAFSIVLLEINPFKYFSVDIGSSVVWPKRFELGYAFPFTENFLYQNNIGDFDNMALFLNMQAKYPGIGNLWFSFYFDELDIEKSFFTFDRSMFAYQIGGSFNFPWMPFTSVTFSYTKNEPYNYTHNRISTPWHTSSLMEQNYVNFGKSLGHYLPPNSDEALIRFETIPFPQSMFSLQYQLIRHGADYGDRAVDGSSLWSELPTYGNRDTLRKYFLRDGAYQWMHIIKLRGEYSLAAAKIPVQAFMEIGGVYSFFTDTNKKLGEEGEYKNINTPQYPHSLSFIGMIGIQIFPKF